MQREVIRAVLEDSTIGCAYVDKRGCATSEQCESLNNVLRRNYSQSMENWI
jgi:hypothetical protein